jgi:lipopolysaccharide export system protein LptA
LRATEVSPLSNKLYEVAKPYLKFFDRTGIRMEAKSSSGIFNLKEGFASGENYLSVESTGFRALGKSWKWSQKSEQGSHQMIFRENGKVSFGSDLRELLSDSEADGNFACPKDGLEESELTLTVAEANVIEFLAVNDRTHHFFLEGNVTVESNELLLTSERVKVEFEKEANSSSDDIGRISRILASGQVEFAQGGRISYCDSLAMDALKGDVVLEGKPARVVDDEWGAAVGNRIVLEKGKRRARVLAGESGGKPRLELPPIPDLGFDRKGKRP